MKTSKLFAIVLTALLLIPGLGLTQMKKARVDPYLRVLHGAFNEQGTNTDTPLHAQVFKD